MEYDEYDAVKNKGDGYLDEGYVRFTIARATAQEKCEEVFFQQPKAHQGKYAEKHEDVEDDQQVRAMREYQHVEVRFRGKPDPGMSTFAARLRAVNRARAAGVKANLFDEGEKNVPRGVASREGDPDPDGRGRRRGAETMGAELHEIGRARRAEPLRDPLDLECEATASSGFTPGGLLVGGALDRDPECRCASGRPGQEREESLHDRRHHQCPAVPRPEMRAFVVDHESQHLRIERLSQALGDHDLREPPRHAVRDRAVGRDDDEIVRAVPMVVPQPSVGASTAIPGPRSCADRDRPPHEEEEQECRHPRTEVALRRQVDRW